MDALKGCFAGLPDPRVRGRCRYELVEIVLLTIISTLCGGRGATDTVLFAECQEEWLRAHEFLAKGIPSHDVIGDVMAVLDPAAFRACFSIFSSKLAAAFGDGFGGTIAIDGKFSRGAASHGGSPLDTVSAWSHETGLVLAQAAVGDKSNEAVAIPALLDLLSIKGFLITIDAAGTTRPIAEKILARKGDYVLALKENQPLLEEAVRMKMDVELDAKQPGRRTERTGAIVEKGHGRIETRRCAVCDEVGVLRRTYDFPGMKCVFVIERTREIGGKATMERAYFISSRRLTAAQAMKAVRGHWGIENRLHWVLDVAFREDACTISRDNGPKNFAVIRHFAVNLLRANPTKGSIVGKMKRAGWSAPFLEAVLAAA